MEISWNMRKRCEFEITYLRGEPALDGHLIRIVLKYHVLALKGGTTFSNPWAIITLDRENIYVGRAVGSPQAEDLTDRFITWESAMQASLDGYGHPTNYDTGTYAVTTRLTTALAIETTTTPTINRSLGVIRVINGRWFMTYDTEYLPLLGQPHHDAWTVFRRLASPGRRRAAFAMTACSMESGWPVYGFMLQAGKAMSGSADWWHHVVMPYQHESSYELFESIRMALSIPPAPKRYRSRAGRPSKNTLPPQSHTWKLAKLRA